MNTLSALEQAVSHPKLKKLGIESSMAKFAA